MPNLKLGCLPGYIPVGLKELPFYKAGSLPKPPAKVVVPTVPAQPDGYPWGMDGNDNYGDCGPAGVNHGFMAVDAILNYPETIPSDQDIVDYYLTYTGGQDSGVVLADFLAYIKQKGFFGHTIKAYAPVGVHDIPTLTFAIDAFDFAYTGITVTKAMQAAYNAGKPWDFEDLFSPVAGGHCVPLVGYDSNYLYCITWGKVQPISYVAWHFMSTEAWAVITGEFVTKNSDGRGLNLAALEADLPELAA
jgi:hypothetical protein